MLLVHASIIFNTMHMWVHVQDSNMSMSACVIRSYSIAENFKVYIIYAYHITDPTHVYTHTLRVFLSMLPMPA